MSVESEALRQSGRRRGKNIFIAAAILGLVGGTVIGVIAKVRENQLEAQALDNQKK